MNIYIKNKSYLSKISFENSPLNPLRGEFANEAVSYDTKIKG